MTASLCGSSVAPLSLQGESLAQAVTRTLDGGERHQFALPVPAQHYLCVEIRQQGIDVVVAVYSSDGKLLASVDRPSGNQGLERLHFISGQADRFRLEVRAANTRAQAGQYLLEVKPARLAQPPDRQLVNAQRAVQEAEYIRAAGTKEELIASLTTFQTAIGAYQSGGDLSGAAYALFGQARTFHFLGDALRALALYQQALALFEQTGEADAEALVRYRIGGVYQSLEPALAPAYFHRATELARTTGNIFIEAKVLTNLGYASWVNGELRQALQQLAQATQMQARLGDQYSESESLVQSSGVLNELGEYEQALATYRSAIRLHQAGGHKREEANALLGLSDTHRWRGEFELAADALARAMDLARSGGYQVIQVLGLLRQGTLQLDLGQPQIALAHYSAALALTGKEGYYLGQPRTLLGLGRAHAALMHYEQALEFLAQALEAFKAQELNNGHADVRFVRGQVYLKLAQPQAALTDFEQARAKFRQVGDRLGEARSLLGRALARAALGQAEEARRDNNESLRLIEGLRAGLLDVGARATFLATVREGYEQQMALLMQQHARLPTAGYEREAFRVSERARSRSLLEMLGTVQVRPERTPDSVSFTALQQLQQEINGKAVRRVRLAEQKRAEKELQKVDAELRALMRELEVARTQLTISHPRYAALTQPGTLDVAEVQQLLDPETMLLEYALGTERSYVWTITTEDITSYELPKRAVIEAAAREVSQAWAANKYAHKEAAVLSQLILAPLAARLQKNRLLIVADGALQYVPFAALPTPNAERGTRNDEVKRSNSKGVGAALHRSTLNAHPLIIDHEIVNLPSASVLAVLRHEAAARPAASHAVAIFAAPVFERTDSGNRLTLGNGTCAETTPNTRTPLVSATVLDGETLRHLPSFTDEANAIRCLAPRDSALVKMGFEATRAAVLQGDLTSYRILHFATHGQLDDTHPDLSWLALSMVDQSGKAQDGFLRLHEIYNLKLNAELVVLSACQTALGKEVKGEGLMGLTRGFMYAGTPRVVASLWKVNSVATTELMKRFYRNMLEGDKKTKQKLSPAAALRAAQLEIREGLKLPSPYYWAAFVLQGEWR